MLKQERPEVRFECRTRIRTCHSRPIHSHPLVSLVSGARLQRCVPDHFGRQDVQLVERHAMALAHARPWTTTLPRIRIPRGCADIAASAIPEPAASVDPFKRVRCFAVLLAPFLSLIQRFESRPRLCACVMCSNRKIKSVRSGCTSCVVEAMTHWQTSGAHSIDSSHA